VLPLICLLVVMNGVVVFRVVGSCENWQESYKRFLYSEMMRSSPVIHTPEMIEQIVGARPLGCDRPSRALNRKDLKRYRNAGVGPNEFVEEIRAAIRNRD
jgi:hypothetical protein